MTLMFCLLFPISRNLKMLALNYSFMMWLHVLVGVGFFFDSWRRRTHPHVWLWNTPFFVWYIVDRISGVTWYRCVHREVSRFKLDDNYHVLMWKHGSYAHRKSRSVCDIYWVKGSLASPLGRWWEWAHPFTTASTHRLMNGRLTIEPPEHAGDIGWAGHKYRVDEMLEAAGGAEALQTILRDVGSPTRAKHAASSFSRSSESMGTMEEGTTDERRHSLGDAIVGSIGGGFAKLTASIQRFGEDGVVSSLERGVQTLVQAPVDIAKGAGKIAKVASKTAANAVKGAATSIFVVGVTADTLAQQEKRAKDLKKMARKQRKASKKHLMFKRAGTQRFKEAHKEARPPPPSTSHTPTTPPLMWASCPRQVAVGP